jgi:hypothetical protein
MQRIVDDLPDKIKALKGFESLPYFTLLNLTLPNSTSHNSSSDDSDESDFDFSDIDFSPTENSENLETTESQKPTEGESMEVIKVPPAVPTAPAEFGDHDINEIIRAIRDAHGSIDGTTVQNRRS